MSGTGETRRGRDGWGRVAQPQTRRMPAARFSAALLVLGAVLVASMYAHAFIGVGGESDLFPVWVFNACLLCASLACLWCAAVRPAQRLVAGVVGTGLLLDAIGGVAARVFLGSEIPVPSIADPFWLAIYPCMYLAIVLMIRQRVGWTILATRLDGMLSGLAVASVVVCISMPSVLAADPKSGFWTRATNFSYPIADLVLLGSVASAAALSGWYLNRKWATLGTAVIVWVVADLMYLPADVAVDKYADALVATGAMLFATAVALWPEVRLGRIAEDAHHGQLLPVALTLLPLGVLVLAGPLGLTRVGVWLAGAAIGVSLIRMAIALRENQRILQASRAEIEERARAQQDLRDILAERDRIDGQMRSLLDTQQTAEEKARQRALDLLNDTTALVCGPLSQVVGQVRTVQTAATSIESQVAAADDVTARVVDQAREADAVVVALTESLHRVSGVASVIGNLADQTNLLALNATIESARAGEAGRSFSIVANEVKQLSQDTARFTEEITSIINSLQADADAVATAIATMSAGIGGIDTATSLIRVEMEQQRAALDQLNRQAEVAIRQARQIGGSDNMHGP